MKIEQTKSVKVVVTTNRGFEIIVSGSVGMFSIAFSRIPLRTQDNFLYTSELDDFIAALTAFKETLAKPIQ